MTLRQKSFIFSLITIFMLGGCSPYSMDAGSIGQAQEFKTVIGQVSAMKPVRINSAGGSGVGAVTGGVLGGILGSLIGGGTGQLLATAGGAAIGGLGGGYLGNMIGGHSAYEIIVEGDDGMAYSIVEHSSINVTVGQRVRLLLGNEYSRIYPL